LFVRHGARYPNPKQVNASKKFLEESSLHLEKSSSFSLLKNIVLTFLNKPAYGLSDLGKKEIFDMAQRYSDRYPHLFKNLEDKKMSVISSVKDRCVDSAREFLNGLNFSQGNIKIDNKMMRLFSECDRYLTGVDKNHSATVHLHKFKNGIEMLDIVKKFKKRHQIEEMNIEPGKYRKAGEPLI
jgi:hypothetical protein